MTFFYSDAERRELLRQRHQRELEAEFEKEFPPQAFVLEEWKDPWIEAENDRVWKLLQDAARGM